LKVEFRSSFEKDLRKIDEKKIREQVKEIIEKAEQAQDIQGLENLRKLRGGDNYYRIRIGNYRIGLIAEGELVIFTRDLHRKDIYRYFP
jgi:mRNA interferase RelE/StbE